MFKKINYCFLSFLLPLVAQAQSESAYQFSGSGLFLYQQSNFHKENSDPAQVDTSPNGFNIQEIELQMNAEIDNQSRFHVLFSIFPEYESDGTTISEVWKISPEQIFLDSSLAENSQLKIGKIKASFGYQNNLHPHEFDFVHTQLANQYVLGDEGLSDTGISFTQLFPNFFKSSITIEGLRGKSENNYFQSPNPNANVGLLRLEAKPLFTNNQSAVIGVSGAQGQNSYDSETTLLGVDTSYKRTLDANLLQSFTVDFEYLKRSQKKMDVSDIEIVDGWSGWLNLNINPEWSVRYRYDNAQIKNSLDISTPNQEIHRNSYCVDYQFTKSSLIRFEYDQTNYEVANNQGLTTEKALYLQLRIELPSNGEHTH